VYVRAERTRGQRRKTHGRSFSIDSPRRSRLARLLRNWREIRDSRAKRDDETRPFPRARARARLEHSAESTSGDYRRPWQNVKGHRRLREQTLQVQRERGGADARAMRMNVAFACDRSADRAETSCRLMHIRIKSRLRRFPRAGRKCGRNSKDPPVAPVKRCNARVR